MNNNKKPFLSKYNVFKNIVYGDNEDTKILLKIVQSNGLINIQTKNILDIYSGDAKRLSYLLDLICENELNVNLDCIENSEENIDNLEIVLNTFENINFNIIKNDTDDLTKNYDLIFLIHGLYLVENMSTIRKYMKNLNKSGSFVIVLNSENSFIEKLKYKMKNITGDKTICKANELLDYLKEEKIDYVFEEIITEFIIEYDTLNYMLDLILSWVSSLARISDIKYEEFDDKRKIELKEFILSLGNKTEKGFLFKETDLCVIIKKTQD